MFKRSNVFSLSVLIGRGFVLYVHSFSLFLVSLFSFEGVYLPDSYFSSEEFFYYFFY